MDRTERHLNPEEVDALPPAVSRLLIIDDDAISREVLAMLALEEGFEVHAFDSGDRALAWLMTTECSMPEAVLTDLHMPGLSGAALAAALRNAVPAGTPVVAMSGSDPEPSIAESFDAFLLKPFTIETLDRTFTAVLSALPHAPAQPTHAGPTGIAAEDDFFTHLDRKTYLNLERSMPAHSLDALLTMCLDDSEKRLGAMRQAIAANDSAAYSRAAHAIKGGCATVGFRHLAALAAQMEQNGLSQRAANGEVDDSSTPPVMIARFFAASAHLRGILNTHAPRTRIQSLTGDAGRKP